MLRPAKLSENERGFIPLLITVLLIVGVLVYIAYVRVLKAN